MKPTASKLCTEARFFALETQLGTNSQPEEDDVRKKEGDNLKEPAWKRNRVNPVIG